MATPAPSAKPTVVTVQRGDCLWNIARDYLGSGTKYTQIAKLNNIPGPKYYIYPGDKLKLSGTASSSSTSSSAVKDKYKPEVTRFGLISDSSSEELFAVWSWTELKDFDQFEYEWEYTIKDTGDTWWTGSKSSTKDYECSWGIPNNAVKVRFRVKPVAQTKQEEKNGKTTTVIPWNGKWSDYKNYNTDSIPPAPPDGLSVRLDENDKFKLIAEINNINVEALDATHVKFQVIKNNKSVHAETKSGLKIDTNLKYVSYPCKLDPGAEYKVRCKSVRGSLESAWSDFASTVISTAPSKPAGFKNGTPKAKSSSTDGRISVYLEWPQATSAKSYDIQYATNRNYFDGTDQVSDISGITLTHHETYSLEPGQVYYFRYRAVNSGGESDWSDISDGVALGEPPVAPTTWSSTTTATVGGPLNLYWVHNSVDGSSQTWAEVALEIYVANGVDENGDTNYEQKWSKTELIKNSTDVDEKDKTSSFDATAYLKEEIPSYYKEGVQLRWRVRTAGVTNEFSSDGWSIVRMVDIYAEPTVTLEVRDATNTINTTYDTLGSLPIYVSAATLPATQAPIGFHLTITSNGSYETVDNLGNDKMVSAGEEIYSRYFDQDTDLKDVILSAGDVDLESGVNYTLTCVAAMNSGLTAEDHLEFTVSWEEVSYVPNAEITYDQELFVAHIRPYCDLYTIVYRGVVKDSDGNYISTGVETAIVGPEPLTRMYMVNGTEVFSEYGEDGVMTYYYLNRYGKRVTIDESQVVRTEHVYTKTGERVCSGLTEFTIDENGNSSGGEEILVCEVENSTPVEGVLLSVYRREFDGSYTELGRDIDNLRNTHITDPHPALDYARYRIVAETQSTGAISYYDMPGIPIGEKSIIIQWAEDWTSFDMAGDDLPAAPPWSGSLLKLPYNVDVSDNYGMDVSLVEYVGRKRPVSYYGTQLGETSTWNTTIPKDDEETLYALRRLAIWTGDVYVREPSGTGYWANIGVSFSQKHRDVTIPVTLTIKRVEGGA